MSVGPISPDTLSRVKYFLMDRLKEEKELLDTTLNKLGPFPIFKVCADFRDAKSGETINIYTANELKLNKEVVKSIAGEVGYERVWPWKEESFTDCIEVTKYRAKGLRDAIKAKCQRSGYVRVIVKASFDGGNNWSDLECEEFSVNLFFGY